MFEWLELEISEIKTPRFHLVDGPADIRLREAVMQSDLPLPSSYKQFALKFGNAKLFRRTESGGYQIGVFAGPKEEVLADGTRIYEIGFYDGAKVYLKPTANSSDFPIFESELGAEKKVANDFEQWLRASCERARRGFSNEKWVEIMHGPAPFTPEEEDIIEARRRIHWRVRGIDSLGNHIIEVTNAGQHTLPVLTVGARSKNRHLNGAILLKIGHIRPGQSAVLHVGCYKDLMPPSEIEVFSLPDPHPEDRDAFLELREFGTM